MIDEKKLEFDTIKDMLAGYAHSEGAKARLLALAPAMAEGECRRRMDETTGARKVLDACGTPPITAMQDLDKIMALCKAGGMLTAEQLTMVDQFLAACQRLQGYLLKAEMTDEATAGYGHAFHPLQNLRDEIGRSIRGGRVEDDASPALRGIRRKAEGLQGQIQGQLAALLQSKKQFLSDGAVVQRGGRYVLPVKREHKGKISGSVVDVSGTGGTVFIEPASVARLQEQLSVLRIEEENEVRVVLYTLSAMVDEHAAAIAVNRDAMEMLDALFAKAKLSAALKAGPVAITTERRMEILNGRHPLLPPERCVPLEFRLGGGLRGVVITGPNTGGKTVALKTVGLLSLMAQCGLHVTAAPESTLCMHNAYLCDIGDGQSISENLSTFSSHITSIIAILAAAGPESLVLLDELGSGTDPAEGMGIAVAVLEALRQKQCMLVATTHYPEVKNYAEQAEGLQNARMEFDRESLQPTYRLELGRAGESCALYIAQRLGLPEGILRHAHSVAYAAPATAAAAPAPQMRFSGEAAPAPVAATMPAIQKAPPPAAPTPGAARAAKFGFGDSVLVYPGRQPGIVFRPANERGEVGVQVKGEKSWVPHKRLKLVASAADLYPEDYDFSVVFDTVANRKARKQIEKGHGRGQVIHHDGEGWGG